MKVGAYQFSGSGDIDRNIENIIDGIEAAASVGVRLLVFHECALTGYPPIEVNISHINFERVAQHMLQIQKLSINYGMYIMIGSAELRNGKIYNSVEVFTPQNDHWTLYDKKALWGWDKDHFTEGKLPGIIDIDGIKVGVRICFEIRFPEYFRELYKQNVDLGIVCFCDISSSDNQERYDLINAHLQTRAVENVIPILAVNNSGPFQAAPTAFYNKNGKILARCEKNRQELLTYEFVPEENDFGQHGRIYINNRIMNHVLIKDEGKLSTS